MKWDGLMIEVNKKRLLTLLIYIPLFYLIIIILNFINRTGENNIKIYFHFLGRVMNLNILDTIIRLIIYIIPILLILKFENENILVFLKLKCSLKKTLIWAFVSILIILLIWFLGVVFYLPITDLPLKQNYNLVFNADLFIRSVVLTGFIEEIVFRGFIFQELLQITKFWVANSINGFLFALYHIPFWLIFNTFDRNYRVSYIIGLVLFSIIQGIVLKKSKSLWVCMIIHMVNNYVGLIITGTYL